jgi:hypothetical protein
MHNVTPWWRIRSIRNMLEKKWQRSASCFNQLLTIFQVKTFEVFLEVMCWSKDCVFNFLSRIKCTTGTEVWLTNDERIKHGRRLFFILHKKKCLDKSSKPSHRMSVAASVFSRWYNNIRSCRDCLRWLFAWSAQRVTWTICIAGMAERQGEASDMNLLFRLGQALRHKPEVRGFYSRWCI